MKGDFSRQTFAAGARKHYSGVLMQQGRVQLDADWNEQGDINRYRTETEAVDVIGGCGAPIHAAGFEITTDGKTLFIGGGRYYVDGLLAENDAGQIAFGDQDKLDLPGADMAAVLAQMKEKGLSAALVYLDVWQRHVTALDDRLLREVALGGPDTTTRIKTVWQVKALPIAGAGSEELAKLREQQKQLEAELASLTQIAAQIQTEAAVVKQKLDQAAPTSPEFKKLQALLQRATAKLAEVQAEADRGQAQLAELTKKIEELGGGSASPVCDAQLPGWDDLFTPSGLLNARAQSPDSTQDACLPPPGAGYRRLENQLYRVEIHQGGPLGLATFKWSRDNGTVVTAIESIQGSVITVHDIGPDDALGFAHGQWVEISDDALELNGLPGQLAQIDTVNAATREIVLLGAAPRPLATNPDGVDATRHPKLRRWDQTDQTGAHGHRPGYPGHRSAGSRWKMASAYNSRQSGPFRTGDYWLIPARTATGDLEWPPFDVPNLNPVPQPPPRDRAPLLPAGADPSAGRRHRQERHRLPPDLPTLDRVDGREREARATRSEDQLGERQPARLKSLSRGRPPDHPGRAARSGLDQQRDGDRDARNPVRKRRYGEPRHPAGGAPDRTSWRGPSRPEHHRVAFYRGKRRRGRRGRGTDVGT